MKGQFKRIFSGTLLLMITVILCSCAAESNHLQNAHFPVESNPVPPPIEQPQIATPLTNAFDPRVVKVGSEFNNLIIKSLEVSELSEDDYFTVVAFEGELLLTGKLTIIDMNNDESNEGWGLGNMFYPNEHSIIHIPVLTTEPNRTALTLLDNVELQLSGLAPGTYETTISIDNFELWSTGKAQEHKGQLKEIIAISPLADNE